MSKVMRRLAVVACVLVGVVVLTAAALPHFVDVNRFRPLIAASVREATGRTLTTGTISLSLLPVPALSVGGPIKFSESAAYPGRDALTADSLSVRLGVLGLLRGRANVTSIILHRPTLILIRDAHGRWNFEDLVERASRRTAAKAGGAREGGGSFVVEVEKARVEGGRVYLYDDAVLPGRRAQVVIAPIEAMIRGWGGEAPTDLDLSAGLGKSLLKAHARLSGRAAASRVTMRAVGSGLRAEDFITLLPWIGVARPSGLQVSGSIDLDGTTDVPIEHPESLRFKGVITLHDVSYRDSGLRLPLKDLSGRLTVDGNQAVWDDFRLKAGSSVIQGRLQVEDFMKPRIGFELASPRLDLNEIVATLMPAGSSPAASAAAAPTEAPAGLLDEIRGSGRLEVGQIRFQTFDLSDLKATMSLSQSVFSVKDLGATLYGGSVQGAASVDVSRAVPRYTAAVRLNNVDVGPLMTAYDPELKGLVRGRLAGDLNLAATGSGMDAILSTAAGRGGVQLVDGSVASFSVLKQLASLLELAGGKGIGKESTPFESLSGGVLIENGRARTDDLRLRSPDLDLDGRGWVGLDATLDLDLAARFSEESTAGMVGKNARLGALTENGRLVVYFGLKGGLAAPAFRLNTRAQAETMKANAKEQVRERLRDSLIKKLVGSEPKEEEEP